MLLKYKIIQQEGKMWKMNINMCILIQDINPVSEIMF